MNGFHMSPCLQAALAKAKSSLYLGDDCTEEEFLQAIKYIERHTPEAFEANNPVDEFVRLLPHSHSSPKNHARHSR